MKSKLQKKSRGQNLPGRALNGVFGRVTVNELKKNGDDTFFLTKSSNNKGYNYRRPEG